MSAPTAVAVLSAMERLAEPGQAALLVEQAGAVGQPDQGPGGVEQVDEEEGEDDGDQASCSAPPRSSCRNVGNGSGGREASPFHSETPSATPAAVTARMPMMTAPGTLR